MEKWRTTNQNHGADSRETWCVARSALANPGQVLCIRLWIPLVHSPRSIAGDMPSRMVSTDSPSYAISAPALWPAICWPGIDRARPIVAR
jgi:hypothetical protein